MKKSFIVVVGLLTMGAMRAAEQTEGLALKRGTLNRVTATLLVIPTLTAQVEVAIHNGNRQKALNLARMMREASLEAMKQLAPEVYGLVGAQLGFKLVERVDEMESKINSMLGKVRANPNVVNIVE